jgi:thioredoxin-related protein
LKKILFVIIPGIFFSFTNWQTSFDKAQQTAREKHRLILLSFSGSDWCSPCIRMRKEIFESSVFSNMADSTLVLYNADFPRNKKNQLVAEQKKQNEALADKYNAEGKFPYTLLLDADGVIIKSWEGLPKKDSVQFTAEVRSMSNAHK